MGRRRSGGVAEELGLKPEVERRSRRPWATSIETVTNGERLRPTGHHFSGLPGNVDETMCSRHVDVGRPPRIVRQATVGGARLTDAKDLHGRIGEVRLDGDGDGLEGQDIADVLDRRRNLNPTNPLDPSPLSRGDAAEYPAQVIRRHQAVGPLDGGEGARGPNEDIVRGPPASGDRPSNPQLGGACLGGEKGEAHGGHHDPQGEVGAPGASMRYLVRYETKHGVTASAHDLPAETRACVVEALDRVDITTSIADETVRPGRTPATAVTRVSGGAELPTGTG